MLNFALFGVGRIGELHAKNIFENSKSSLLCIYDTNLELAKKIASKYKCKVAKTPEEALEDKNIDAVVIASPTHTHIEFLVKSAEKKKAVFCEKPIDLDIKKINECEKMLMEFNVPIQICFNRRFDKDYGGFSSSRNNLSATSLSHPGSKSMSSFSYDTTRLICSFHKISLVLCKIF